MNYGKIMGTTLEISWEQTMENHENIQGNLSETQRKILDTMGKSQIILEIQKKKHGKPQENPWETGKSWNKFGKIMGKPEKNKGTLMGTYGKIWKANMNIMKNREVIMGNSSTQWRKLHTYDLTDFQPANFDIQMAYYSYDAVIIKYINILNLSDLPHSWLII